MPGYDHLYGSTTTSGGTGTSSGAVGGYTPPSGGGGSSWGNTNTNTNNNNNVNTSIYQEMANNMKQAGQIGGGLSGGVYTKKPVVYHKSFYTPEGWAEVQKKGWSDKLYQGTVQGKKPAEWILSAKDPKDIGGKFGSLPEGILYSSNIGNPQRGYGGTIRTNLFTSPGQNDQGSRGLGRYFGNWGGSSQYDNPYGRYSKANWHLKNKYNYDSPIAALLAERRANPVQPQNIPMYTQMMANMNKGGIMSLRR